MKLNGLIAATYTPFLEDGSVHYSGIGPMVEHMISRGVSGFYVCGSTGEGESLTINERKRVAEETIKATRGRVPVVVQVGHNSIGSACELAYAAAEAGADAISTLPPTYFKPSAPEDLVDWVAQVAGSASELPYYYYHIPRLSGVAFDPLRILELASARVPNFAGIKFSDFFLADFMACQDFEEGRYDILFGSDEMILGALATGATGAVGSCYGFAAPLWLNILDAFKKGESDKARAWMSQAARLVRLIGGNPGPFQACVKQVIWPLLGFEVGPLRMPQVVLSPSQVDEARRSLDASGFSEAIATGRYSL